MKHILLKISLGLFLCILNHPTQAQSEKKHLKFEKKLNEFRYSLYADFETVDELSKLIEKSSGSHPLLKKMEDFVLENEEEIANYQRYKLSEYKDKIIDFNQYERDTTFFNSESIKLWSDALDEYNSINKLYGKSLGKFLTLNPINYTYMIKNIYLARTLSAMEMGTRSMKDAIAFPKIKTTLMKENHWKIWFDHYTYLYEFDYDMNQNTMKIVGVYYRQK